MNRGCWIAAGVVLVLTVLAEVYFGTVFNESVRHSLDIPAMLFVAPGLLVNRVLHLGLPFDGPNHSAVIWMSGAVYAMIAIGVVVVVRAVPGLAQGRADQPARPGR